MVIATKFILVLKLIYVFVVSLLFKKKIEKEKKGLEIKVKPAARRKSWRRRSEVLEVAID